MKTSLLQYELPSALIAQQPAEPRDASRLMVIDRQGQTWTHHSFREIVDYLHPNDLMIVNNTRVIPAKFAARRASGATISGLFLQELTPGRWEVLAGNTKRVKSGEWLNMVGGDWRMRINQRGEQGRCVVDVDPADVAMLVLEAIGATPLPPYIERAMSPAPEDDAVDRDRYQTIFASKPGAVAAPTAGLHFTEHVLSSLHAKGVRQGSVTLHVGTGTFAPVTVDDLSNHQMHSEWFEFSQNTGQQIADARTRGGRVVAIGTTSVRVLESVNLNSRKNNQGWTDLLICPPYSFRNTDVLLTNLHLPGSTLLALVAAFAGYELIMEAYRAAIKERYRFFSYGDAMLII